MEIGVLPKNFSFYTNISKNQLDYALSVFEGYWKIYSILVLKHLNFPVLKGIILTTFDAETRNNVIQFSKVIKSQEFLLRHDRKPEVPNAPRGGYIVSIKELEKELSLFFKQRRIVVLLEPVSPYDDIYSCNVLFDRAQNCATIEIVGPGFDVSDLNRGDISPHEIIEFNFNSLTTESFKKIYTVDNRSYKKSVKLRLQKIGRRVSGQFNIEGKSNLHRSGYDGEFEAIGLKFLKNNHKNLLLDNLETYQEIPFEYLLELIPYIQKFPQKIEKFGMDFKCVVLSMGFLTGVGLIFWDIVAPETKYCV